MEERNIERATDVESTAVTGVAIRKVTLPTITIWQPWSLLLAKGAKRFETRHWPPPERLIGREWGIHAASRAPRFEDCSPLERIAIEKNLGLPAEHWGTLPRGAMVATARLEGVYRVAKFVEGENRIEVGVRLPGSDRKAVGFVFKPGEAWFGDYRPGRWLWHFDNVKPIEPAITVKGAQGIWTWKGELPK